MEITIKPMTKELCRAFYKDFVLDIDLFADPEQYKPFIYNEEACDAYYERYRNMGRIHLAVILSSKPIGEIVLKNIDRDRKCCTMGITMVNDSYKGKDTEPRQNEWCCSMRSVNWEWKLCTQIRCGETCEASM